MGLDQYLYEKVYLNHWEYNKDTPEYRKAGQVLQIAGLTTTPESGGVSVQATVLYWRKANQIHQWFVDHCQDGKDDGQSYYVDSEQLIELRDTCQKVIDASELVPGKVSVGQTLTDGEWVDNMEDGKTIADPSVAQELLPVQVGFFFGNYEYGEWYLADLTHTVEGIDRVLANRPTKTNKEGHTFPTSDFEYYASW